MLFKHDRFNHFPIYLPTGYSRNDLNYRYVLQALTGITCAGQSPWPSLALHGLQLCSMARDHLQVCAGEWHSFKTPTEPANSLHALSHGLVDVPVKTASLSILQASGS